MFVGVPFHGGISVITLPETVTITILSALFCTM